MRSMLCSDITLVESLPHLVGKPHGPCKADAKPMQSPCRNTNSSHRHLTPVHVPVLKLEQRAVITRLHSGDRPGCRRTTLGEGARARPEQQQRIGLLPPAAVPHVLAPRAPRVATAARPGTQRGSVSRGGSLVRMHARACGCACARARACVCVSERSLTSNSTRDDSAESRKEAGSGGSSAESRLSVTEASSAACGARLTGHAASGLAPPSLPPPSPHRRHHH